MCSLWSLDENRKEASSVEMQPCEPQVPHHKEDPSAGALVPQDPGNYQSWEENSTNLKVKRSPTKELHGTIVLTETL